ncbi:MAG: MBL fold metallo-hydrolase [Bacteroidetes bacterium]|nr:MBL fold metallo-hydrolase [Bacteroidota bacterium]
MIIEQIYTGCLAQGAYYIESDGEAAIIDPLRETKPYLLRAAKNKAKIKYVFETHFHADFVSGHVTLAKETGAQIVYGPTAQPDFEALIASDGQVFEIGKLKIIALHTPGHTMESTTYLLRDANGKDHAIFSGDTLFLGDVGRPDLAQKAAHMTQEELAGLLFDSLQTKIIPLSDDVLVYPAHGAGSACGKNMMKETVDTLGNQKKINYALRANMTRDEFIQEVTDGLMPPPKYFPLNVQMNKRGYEDIQQVLDRGLMALTPNAFEEAANATHAVILDVRSPDEFAQAHIPKSIFIGIDGGFAPWVGALISDTRQEILLVAPKGREEEVITRLSRVGFDHTVGYLEGGFDAWKTAGKETDHVDSISAENLKHKLSDDQLAVIDVRKPGEYESSHLPQALSLPLDFINEQFDTLPKNKSLALHCAGGYRSMIAASILKSRGIHNLMDVTGGFKAIQESGITTTAVNCPSTQKN